MGAGWNSVDPQLVDAGRALLSAASAAGLQPRITSTFRSHAEQKRLYGRFLAGQQGYPVAPPGKSAHEYGLAFDMVVSPMSALADVGYTWQSWGGGWNGADAIHFELPGSSQWASQQQSLEEFDPYLAAAKAADTLPWYVQLLTPWQLSLYEAIPENLRYLINPSLPLPAVRIMIEYLSGHS